MILMLIQLRHHHARRIVLVVVVKVVITTVPANAPLIAAVNVKIRAKMDVTRHAQKSVEITVLENARRHVSVHAVGVAKVDVVAHVRRVRLNVVILVRAHARMDVKTDVAVVAPVVRVAAQKIVL